MNPVERLIRERIASGGPMTVADYMSLALGHPEHGYYHAQEAIGAAGDFTTAPEISQMFGEMIGLWAAVVWQQMGAPASLRLVELGPGRGTLMTDLLRAAETVPDFAAALDIHFVETSPRLRAAQRAALPGRMAAWHDNLASVPAGPTIIVANEFFDALPVNQFIRQGNQWCERHVGLADDGNGGLEFVTGRAAGQGTLPAEIHELTAPDGAIIEDAPARAAAVREIADRLATEDGGAALIIDYGHIVSAPGDTLQAVKDHAPHSPLDEPGMADLTSHVDFAALARACAGTSTTPHGPVEQGRFLLGLGIEARAATLLRNAPSQSARDVEQALTRLTGSDAMGSLFKVLALTRKDAPVPPGFEGTTARRAGAVASAAGR